MVMWRDIQANDGEKIAYQTHGEEKSMVLILIHGFTGSSDYFQRNFEALSQKYFVVAPDLRGHGKSTKAHHGYHVSRLAADLRDLLAHISRSDIQLSSHESPSIIGVGCSLGAAVLWSYSELFGTEPFSGMVFVDQAPLQDYIPGSWDFKQGNYGVHDPTSLAAAQATLKYAPEDFYRGLVHGCLAYNHEPTESERDSISPLQKAKDESFFIYISKNGNPWWFGKLLADHTSYDHRNTIMNLIRVPTFVMAGRRSGSFPVDGVLETAYLANSHSTSPGTVSTIVMDSGHWMFYEEPDKWNQHIIDFADKVEQQKPPPKHEINDPQVLLDDRPPFTASQLSQRRLNPTSLEQPQSQSDSNSTAQS